MLKLKLKKYSWKEDDINYYTIEKLTQCKLAIHATTITQEFLWMEDTPDFLTAIVAANSTHLFD